MIRNNTLFTLIIAIAFITLASHAHGQPAVSDQLPTVSGLQPESAGKGGPQAAASVVRVICTGAPSSGTGFVHKSGWVVTAAHVVRPCGDSVIVRTAGGQNVSVNAVRRDDLLDLAILSTDLKLEVSRVLPLSTSTTFAIGAQVSTWGFPAGYSGAIPLLSVGYLAGVDQVKSEYGLSPPLWVVNGAFNSGNSGGPVISTENASVIGIVSSKLAPIPKDVDDALNALSSNQSGLVYKRRNSDGTLKNLSEGQVVAEVLRYLRSQMQLVVGYSVSVKELRKFLEANGIEP